MNEITLKVIRDNREIFQSDKHWLFPLFDLEICVSKHNLDVSKAEIYDKIVGKAAAFLILRLGVGMVHADVISKLAREVFDQASIPYSYNTLVDRIDCQTEEILRNINDPEIAYRILHERAR